MSQTITADGEAEAPTLPAPAPAPRLEPGAKIDRYVILEELGAGGMGVVYAARDPELRRDLAIKVLHPGWLAIPEARARFLREAQTMAQLSHPNLVPIWDVGTIGEQLFLAMPKLDGGTLRVWLERERAWPEVLAVLLAAARGLAAAHAKGIVHRDFKPDNVLIGDDGAPRVADFGIAQSVAEASDPAGTPRYMAPEQRRGDPTDARCDQYSFALVMREALRAAPRWLARIVTRGLAEDREARWPSLIAMMDAVAREQRRRRLAKIAIAGAIGLGLLTTGVAMMVRRAPGTASPSDVRPVRVAYFRPDNHERDGTITPDGATLVFSSGKTVWLQDRARGTRTDLRVPDGLMFDQILAGDGARTVVVSGQRPDGTHEAWRLTADAAPVRLAAAPTDFSISLRKDGSALALRDDQQIRVVDTASGADLATLPLTGGLSYDLGWAPDGTRLGLVHYQDAATVVELITLDGAITPVLHKDLGGIPVALTWMAPDRIALAMTTPQTTHLARAFITEVGLDGSDRRVVDRDAEFIPYAIATPDGLFVESIPLSAQIMTAPLAGLHDDAQLTALATGSQSDSRVAGWTDDGRLLFGTWRGDSLATALATPGGALDLIDTPADDIPAAVLPGGDVLTLQRTDDRVAIVRGTRTLAELAKADNPALICADGHPPCLVSRGPSGARSYARLDVDTGEIAAPLYVDPHAPTERAAIPALSPDGAALAIAHFENGVELVDTATGAHRTLTPGGGVRIQCLGWMPDGSAMLATDAQETLVSLGRLDLDGSFHPLLASETRWYCDPRVTRDAATLAVLTNDLTASYWLYEGYR